MSGLKRQPDQAERAMLGVVVDAMASCAARDGYAHATFHGFDIEAARRYGAPPSQGLALVLRDGDEVVASAITALPQ